MEFGWMDVNPELEMNFDSGSIFLSNLHYIWRKRILEERSQGRFRIEDRHATIDLLYKYIRECTDKDNKMFYCTYFHHFEGESFVEVAIDKAIQYLIKEGVITVNKKDEEE